MRSSAPKVEDVPELIQQIQSRVPAEDAVRTSMLSKSWLHAWSTIPILRFCVYDKEPNRKSIELVDRTLNRYLRDNIPIERFLLNIDVDNQESASHAEKWIASVVSKSSLKELSLSFYDAPFTLPDGMLSSENLTKIRVSTQLSRPHSVEWMTTTTPMRINCASTLRELELKSVRISEEALHDILSSCSLLVKIELMHSCKGFKTIKVKNLPCLYELNIFSEINDDGSGYRRQSTPLEISHVPNLGVFRCDLNFPFNAPSISLGSKVTQLTLHGGMITDNSKACLNIIGSAFPFLESLTLADMRCWMSESFNFKCASIKSLSLRMCLCTLIDVQVHAPKLQVLKFQGGALPSLLFPVSTLDQLSLSLILDRPVDAYFFLSMREALTLSRKCDLCIYTTYNSTTLLPLHIDIDDLRTRLLFPPATNVQLLWFGTENDECLWERSAFFDAFFEICHPKQVFAKPDSHFRNNHFCRLMLREVLEKKTTTTNGTPYWRQYLKHVQIRETHRQEWETLTNSHTSVLDGSYVCKNFNLNWC